MAKQPMEFIPPEGKKDFDNLSVDYKLKLIAYQDEIFRAKKKLQESDVRMNDLQTKLDNYLRNKENQLAEVMFTAHTNAQRIEAQARSQVQYYLDEMELELQRKQREIEIIEDKTSQFDQALVTPSEPLVEVEKIAHLTVVESSGVAAETAPITEPMDIQPEAASPTGKKQRVVAAKKGRGTKAGKKADKAKLPVKQSEPVAEEYADQPQVDQASPVAETAAVVNLPSFEPIDADALMDTAVPAAAAMSMEETVATDIPPVGLEDEAATEPISAEERLETTEATPVVEETPEEVNLEASGEEVQLESEETAVPVEAMVPPAAAKPAEVKEYMQLDAFIDVRYFNDVTGTKELYHHALQVTIEVEVPADNYSVRYTKVSSDVVSTLMKYDNVILNELYPFNFVAPNPNSIATYFFNLLDDMLGMMDLRLHKMIMTEFPDLCIEVDQRNVAFDNMLHKGEDMFQDIRESLPACVEVEPRDSSSFTGTLSKLLKRK